jgi:GntR family transcriptional regulator, transcriptional repressor for pyruvate dehydrogenase complex
MVQMALRVVQSRSLADQIFEQLVIEILSGRCAVGTNLPPERKLVETFEVNRHVVREALKRLEQVGLVKISQGGGTKVADFTRHAGLDLLALMADYASTSEDTLSYWLAVQEMRLATAADVARLCALRAGPELRQEILSIARRMSETEDPAEIFALELRFWDRMLEGAQNIAYRLAFNSLIKGVLAPKVADVARALSVKEIRQTGHRLPIASAVAKGDAHAAEARTREALCGVVEQLARQVHRADRAVQRLPASAADKRRAIARKRKRRMGRGPNPRRVSLGK